MCSDSGQIVVGWLGVADENADRISVIAHREVVVQQPSRGSAEPIQDPLGGELPMFGRSKSDLFAPPEPQTTPCL